jgi:hypothetical protein
LPLDGMAHLFRQHRSFAKPTVSGSGILRHARGADGCVPRRQHAHGVRENPSAYIRQVSSRAIKECRESVRLKTRPQSTSEVLFCAPS